MSLNIDLIESAARRLAGHVRHTPLLSSPFIDDLVGRRVLVKPECLQHTGSFKFRGAWAAISALARGKRPEGIIAYSSGNHAQGVAAAAAAHDLPAVIVMPADAPLTKIENTRALGAEVVLYDRAVDDRDEIGARLAAERGLHLVKPFDDEDVISGQATVGLEIARQADELGIGRAAVLVPCGGGGLTAGIALALGARAPDMAVHPVEPEGFDDMARSMRSGRREANPRNTGSICDAVLTPSPGTLTFPIIKAVCGAGLVVTDAAAMEAMRTAFTRLKIIAEPGGAIALAAALTQHARIDAEAIVVVISGGNVDPSVFATALTRPAGSA